MKGLKEVVCLQNSILSFCHNLLNSSPKPLGYLPQNVCSVGCFIEREPQVSKAASVILHPPTWAGHSARYFKTLMLMTIDGVFRWASLFFGGARWAVCVHELLLSFSFSPFHRMCPSPFLQLSWTCLWLQNFFGLVKLPSPFLLLLCLPHFCIFGLLLAFDLPFSFSQISSFSSLCLAISQSGELGNSSAPGEMFYLL